MIELEHSPLGGSGAHRFLKCAGSFLLHREQLEAGEFEQIESEFAKLGTAAHEVCALAVQTSTEPFEFFGQEFGGYKVGYPDGIDLDAVQVWFNECMSILSNTKEKTTGRALIEETIHLKQLHPLLRGTIDFGFWSPLDGVYLRDYKNGEGVGVSAIGNEQLLYYAFLMIMSDNYLASMPVGTKVSLGIVQPNFYGVFEDPDVWETTLGYVIKWGNEVLLPAMHNLVMTRDISDSDFVPGDHCQFCPVLLDCPKMQRAFEEYADASEDFIEMLTDQELDHYYSQRENARRFMNALESVVYARLVSGRSISSAKLVEKRVNRTWKPGAQDALVEAFGEQAFKPKEIKSPAQIEKMSSRGKEMAIEWGYKPDSAGLSVAPITDPRPEAKPRTNATVFENYATPYEDQGF